MKNKKTLIIASSCLGSAVVLTPLVSCACILTLHNETPVLDSENLIVEDNVLKGIDWSKISIEEIRSQGIKKLIIPKNVTEIAPYAFAYLFDDLSMYIREIDFSLVKTTLEKIGNGAFNYCYGIQSELDFSDFEKLTYIGDEAFFYCTGVKNLKLPNTQLEIGNYAFFDADGLTELVVPTNIKSIGSHAFDGCINLNKIDLLNFNQIPRWLWEGSWIFNEAGQEAPDPTVNVKLDINDVDDWESALNTRQKLPTTWKIESEEEITTSSGDFLYEDEDDPNAITGLQATTLARIDEIKCISIPEGTTKIADGAFKNVFSLSNNVKVPKNLSLNKDLKEIGESAFEGCEQLIGSLTLPKGLTDLGKFAFKNCYNLKGDVVIPNGVKKLKEQAFAYSGIHSIKFHEGIEDAERQVFMGCHNLSIIDLSCYGYGKTPTWTKYDEDEDKPFYNTIWTNGNVLIHQYEVAPLIISQITTFLEENGFPESRLNHGEDEWSTDKWKCIMCDEKYAKALPQDSVNKAYVVYQKEVKSLTKKFKDDKYKEYGIVAIPEDAESIAENAFEGKFAGNNVTWRLVLNTGLTEIKQAAFKNCSRLNGSLLIPTSVSIIGENAFNGCDHFSGSLILPKNIEQIKANAFAGTNFHTILLPSTNGTTIGNKAFVASKTTKSIDFTRFESAPTAWDSTFIEFASDSSGIIWAANATQRTNIQNYLNNTSWAQVQSSWPIVVIGGGE